MWHTLIILKWCSEPRTQSPLRRESDIVDSNCQAYYNYRRNNPWFKFWTDLVKKTKCLGWCSIQVPVTENFRLRKTGTTVLWRLYQIKSLEDASKLVPLFLSLKFLVWDVSNPSPNKFSLNSKAWLYRFLVYLTLMYF